MAWYRDDNDIPSGTWERFNGESEASVLAREERIAARRALEAERPQLLEREDCRTTAEATREFFAAARRLGGN